MTRTIMTIPFPANFEKSKVTFDQNYNGGTSADCYYLDNYWTNGDGSFDAPERDNGTFRGWFTEKDGGVRVETFEDLSGSDVTLYAHWWGDWKISKEPTKTTAGTLTRSLESNENITEEKTLPDLSDTSVWTLKAVKEPTTEYEGFEMYQSEYGRVIVTLPRKEIEKEWDIYFDKSGKYCFVLWGNDTYYAVFEIGGQSETVEMPNKYDCTWTLRLPESLSGLSGTLTVTLYDGEMQQLCQKSFEVT